MRFCPVVAVVLLATGLFTARAADPGTELNDALDQQTDGRFKLMFEFRTRFETRDDSNFGKSVNLENPLLRTRIGAQFSATDWLRFSATGQDCRAPQYGGA